MARKNLLIVGCGDLGIRLSKMLTADDWQLYGMRRRVDQLPPNVIPLAADLALSEPLAWPQSAPDYVLYCAAADGHDEASYRLAYVQGLARVLRQLQQLGQRPRRLFFVSSTAVYGQSQGQWVDESSVCEPMSFSGRVLLEAEALALASGVASTVVRLAGLYHPDKPWMLEQIREGAQSGAQPVHYGNRIHRDDAAALLGYLLRADAQGQVLDTLYLGVDDQPVAMHELVQWVRAQLAISQDNGQQLGRRAGSKRCSNQRARSLGWVPQYPSYREGYAAAIERIKQQGR